MSSKPKDDHGGDERAAVTIQVRRRTLSFLVRLLLFLVLSGLFLWWRSKSREGRQIVARVGGVPITREELANRLIRKHGASELEQMIKEQIVNQVAQQHGLAVSKEEIDEELDQIIRGYGSREAFLEDLAKRHSNEAAVREWLKNQLLLEKAIALDVTERDLEKYYREHKPNYEKQETVVARHVVVRTEQQAKEIAERIRRGEKMEALAKQYSIDPNTKEIGGWLGPIERGMVDPLFEKALFSLEPGEVSEPVLGELGYHVLQVEQKFPYRPSTFGESKDKVLRDLVQERTNAWLEERMKEIKIERFLTEVQAGVPRPAPAASQPQEKEEE